MAEGMGGNEAERLRRACSTIFFATGLIAFLGVAFGILFYKSYPELNPRMGYSLGLLLLGVLIVLVLGGGSMSSKASLLLTDASITDRMRGLVVQVITILFVAIIGFLCYVTGGTDRSPFTHFLLASSSVGVIFAKSTVTRLAVMFACVAPYHFFKGSLFLLSESLFREQLFGYFDVACLMLALSAAIFAADKNIPENGRQISKSASS